MRVLICCLFAFMASQFAAHAQSGKEWTPIPQPAAGSFPGGHGARAVFFDNYFYVIGAMNCILRSKDGSSWEKVVEPTPFGKITGHAVVVFKNSIWVLGGVRNELINNEIWSSPDGVKWTRVVEHAAWSARYYHAAVVFGGKIWLMGGCNKYEEGGIGENINYASVLNDVWSSSNGKDWSKVKTDAAWSDRCGHSVAVYDDYMWLAGGNKGNTHMNDLWRSSNGKDWTLIDGACDWPARRDFALTELNGRLWLFGGSKYVYTPSDEDGPPDHDYDLVGGAWSSSDGKTWKQEAKGAWCERWNCPSCTADASFWTFPGAYTTTWRTSNGTTWTQVLPNLKTPLGDNNIPFVHNSKIWVLRKPDASGWYPPAFWSSSDGANWTLRSHPDGVAAPSFKYVYDKPEPISFNGKIWALQGYRLKSSSLGHDWEDSTNAAPANGVSFIIAHDKKIWLFRPPDEGETKTYTEIWHSTDGSTWTLTAGSKQANLYIWEDDHVVSFKGRLWSLHDKIRYTVDGSQWFIASETLPWKSLYFQTAVASNKLWVLLNSGEVWSSPDGVQWAKISTTPPWTESIKFNLVSYNDALWCLSDENPNPGPIESGQAWRYDTKNGAWSKAWESYQ